MNLEQFSYGGYTTRKARDAAVLAELAYGTPEHRIAWLRETFGPDHCVFHRTVESENSQAYVLVQGTHAAIGIRGTTPQELSDLLDDLDVRRDPLPGGGRFHHGFNRYAKRLIRGVTEVLWKFPQVQTVSLHGHSLGAAASVRLALILHAQVTGVWLFGCPGVGDRALVNRYDRLLGRVTWCHQNNNDPVCWVPLLLRRVGRRNRRYFTFRGEVLVCPRWWQRLRDARRGAMRALWNIACTAVDRIRDGVSWRLAVPQALRQELDDFDHNMSGYVRLTAAQVKGMTGSQS